MFALVGLLLLAIAVMVSVAQEYMALVLLIGAALIVIVLVGHHSREEVDGVTRQTQCSRPRESGGP